jgi:hypothetical protein
MFGLCGGDRKNPRVRTGTIAQTQYPRLTETVLAKQGKHFALITDMFTVYVDLQAMHG